jgi:phosphoribosylaminoimidazole-succinocarboxamide synthase
VRDNYAVGDDRILMVASDRLSAFDVILGVPIPGKGALLTQMALFWFERLGHICPNHLTGESPESVVTRGARPGHRPLHAGQAPEADPGRGGGARLPGRQRLEGIPGRPDGVWRAAATRACTTRRSCPSRSTRRPPRPRPASTTRTSPSSAPSRSSARPLAAQIRDTSIALYKAGAAIAAERGIIIADTKFEFGLDAAGQLVLMDEVLTPDSSRFWPMESYREGSNPPSYDKQFVRDWLEQVRIDGNPGTSARRHRPCRRRWSTIRLPPTAKPCSA